jgi:hypothetical protein
MDTSAPTLPLFVIATDSIGDTGSSAIRADPNPAKNNLLNGSHIILAVIFLKSSHDYVFS